MIAEEPHGRDPLTSAFGFLEGRTNPMTSPPVRVVEAELSNPEHAQAVVAMTAAYAEDDMGYGGPLPSDVLDGLVPALRAHPTTIIFLAYADDSPVGIATCFLGFSTFAARPLINVHDLAVLPAYRGHGVGRLLLAAVEERGRRSGCVKITLEVQENNHRARGVYESLGFSQALFGSAAGGSLFYTKSLPST